MGIPFMAVHGIHGTDYEKIRKDFLQVPDPYSGKMIFVVPAITPDFCLIHALKSDPQGNLIVSGNEAHRLAALSATTTIASVEEIVGENEFIAKAGQVFLSALHVDMVVHRPVGAHPTSCPGLYPLDGDHIQRYKDCAETEEKFQAYLQQFVSGLSEDEYGEKIGTPFLKHALS